MPRQHKDFFHSMSREAFEDGVRRLNDRIPQLDDDEIVVEMARLVNAVGDGHSGMRLYFDPAIALHGYPLRLGIYPEGVFVEAAVESLAAVVGARLTGIGPLETEEAVAAVAPLIARDNDQDLETFAPALLVMAEVLHAVGMAPTNDDAEFHFQKDGRTFSRTLVPGGVFRLQGHSYLDLRYAGGGWVDAREQSGRRLALRLRGLDQPFWFHFLQEAPILYVRLNEIQDGDDETLSQFSERMLEFIRSHAVEKLVIDLRWNRGGNNYLNRDFVRAVIHAEEIDRRGRLFALIGHRTFSAAQALVDELEKYTNVVFVGEPTAQHPNHFGDNRKIRLPNSGITLRASYLFWQPMDPRDDRIWTAPEIAAPVTWADYLGDHDSALEAVRHFDPTPLGERVEAAYGDGGEAGVEAFLTSYGRDPAHRFQEIERKLNELGYGFARDDELDEAAAVFRANVKLFPESWNAYDSLGEVYSMLGDRENAIANYRKSLELNPGNANGVEMLKRLKAGG
jgi:tetratricopeptide (TPR) repeat protein